MGQFALAFMLKCTAHQPNLHQPNLISNLNVHPAFTECGPRRPGRLRTGQPLRPQLCGGGEDLAGQAIPLQPRLLCTGARIRTERVGGTSQGEKDYMAGMKKRA